MNAPVHLVSTPRVPLEGALWASKGATRDGKVSMKLAVGAALLVELLLIAGISHVNFTPDAPPPPKELRVRMAPPPPPPPPPEVKKLEPPSAPTPQKPAPKKIEPKPLPTRERPRANAQDPIRSLRRHCPLRGRLTERAAKKVLSGSHNQMPRAR